MALVSINWRPIHKELRDFGDIALAMLTALALLLAWRGVLTSTGALVLCGAGLVVYLLSRISTKLVKPVYLGLTLSVFPIGWVISHLVMLIVYFGLLTPLGWIFRLMGRDTLHRKFDPSASTYWARRPETPPKDRYFRQF